PVRERKSRAQRAELPACCRPSCQPRRYAGVHYFGRFLALRDSRISFCVIHGWSAYGGPTMANTKVSWKGELGQWLKPFLERLGHKARRRMCPLYVAGLIGPGDRKSVSPMAERFAPGDYDQLHHFVAAGVWDAAPLETELLIQADKLVGGGDAVLVIDD